MIIGDPVDSVEVDSSFGPEVVFTVEVDEVLVGSVEPVIEVSAGSGSCAVPVPAGPQAMVLFTDPDGRFLLAVCGDSPTVDELRAAASPLPAPTGTGPAEAIVGARAGPARLVAVDARGEAVAYGAGRARSASSPCAPTAPGSSRHCSPGTGRWWCAPLPTSPRWRCRCSPRAAGRDPGRGRRVS